MTELKAIDPKSKEANEALRCPSCGALALVNDDEEIGGRCGVCGAPRIRLDPGQPALRGTVKRRLKKARSHQVRRSRLRWLATVTVVVSSVTALALYLLSFLARVGIPPWFRLIALALETTLDGLSSGLRIASLVVLATGAVGGTVAFMMARRVTPRMLGEIDEANLEHARQLLERQGRINLENLEQALGIEPDEAEAVLIRLATDDGARLAMPRGSELALELVPQEDAQTAGKRLR